VREPLETPATRDALDRAAARVDRWTSGDDIVFARTTDGSMVTAHLWPIMPHGRWIVWGG